MIGKPEPERPPSRGRPKGGGVQNFDMLRARNRVAPGGMVSIVAVNFCNKKS